MRMLPLIALALLAACSRETPGPADPSGDLTPAPPTDAAMGAGHPCAYVVPPILAEVTGVPESLENFRHRLAVYALEEWELAEEATSAPPSGPAAP